MISSLPRATPGSKVHGANMGPIWGRQDPGGYHVSPMNFAIWDITYETIFIRKVSKKLIHDNVLNSPNWLFQACLVDPSKAKDE